MDSLLLVVVVVVVVRGSRMWFRNLRLRTEELGGSVVY